MFYINYDCLIDLLRPLSVSWLGTDADETSAATSIAASPPMGTAVGVACWHMVVVAQSVVLGAADVL